jgi:hypothetical protein
MVSLQVDEMMISGVDGSHDSNARALYSRRIVTQNRVPLLLNGLFLAEFSRQDEA